MGPNDKFDLVIKGGDVLDPSQSLRGKRDIGIRFGMIEALEADIPAARAERVLERRGKLVTPGLIDLHAHVFPYGSAIGIPADELVAHQAPRPACRPAMPAPTTSRPSAATSSGRRARGSTRSCISPTSGLTPFPVAELYNIDFAQVDAAPRRSPRTPTSCSASRCACPRT